MIQNDDWEERRVLMPGTGERSWRTCHWAVCNTCAFSGCVCLMSDLDIIVCLWLKWTSGITCWHLILLRILIFLFQASSKSKEMVMSRPHGMLTAATNHTEVWQSVVTVGHFQPSGSWHARWNTLIDYIFTLIIYIQIHCVFSPSHIHIFSASSAPLCLRLLCCEFSLSSFKPGQWLEWISLTMELAIKLWTRKLLQEHQREWILN